MRHVCNCVSLKTFLIWQSAPQPLSGFWNRGHCHSYNHLLNVSHLLSPPIFNNCVFSCMVGPSFDALPLLSPALSDCVHFRPDASTQVLMVMHQSMSSWCAGKNPRSDVWVKKCWCMVGPSFDAGGLKRQSSGFCSNLRPLWQLPLGYFLVRWETLKWMNEISTTFIHESILIKFLADFISQINVRFLVWFGCNILTGMYQCTTKTREVLRNILAAGDGFPIIVLILKY